MKVLFTVAVLSLLKFTYSEECADIPNNCGTFKYLCEENPLVIKTVCPMTCGLCPKVPNEEEKLVAPSGKNDFLRCGPVGRDNCDPQDLAIGNHEFCGPYTKHYTNRQCEEVGLDFGIGTSHGITVSECEALCKRTEGCTAINWSHKRGLGCVLRACGPGAPPMPVGYNNDFLSFSRVKPDITPRCKNLHGSYETPNKYCGPYPNHFFCRKVDTAIVRDVLECEELCEADTHCNVFNLNVHGLLCELRACPGRFTPNPIGVGVGWVSYSKKKPMTQPKCILNHRPVDP